MRMNKEFVHAVPHLTTALTGPLLDLEQHLLEHQARIEAWLRGQWLDTPAPFYASVDLRNAGFKVAPVDTNLFPAGFNNLNEAFIPLCIHAVQSAMERLCPTACKVLLVPESHTRNIHYLESLATLRDILIRAGYEVCIGLLPPSLEEALPLTLPSGRSLQLQPMRRSGNKVYVDGFQPCTILLNNDLSSGPPAILDALSQPIIPPPELGWWRRLKSSHFSLYSEVADEFSELVKIDPWLIEPMFRKCGEIDFMKREGEECLAHFVDALLTGIRQKYEQYGIDREPFVVVKADAGTYGMAIMTVFSADEVRDLNRKQRTKMAATKGGRAVHNVILQEGVYTFETWGPSQAVAEPVVYMMDHFVVGGFYRVHTSRGPDENLNSPGMQFEPLAFADSCINPQPHMSPDACPNRFYTYGVIARLALLAAAREQEELKGA